ncbi:hypothetical protein YN1_7270 [Nanoarchaeota archaeon]
MSNFIEKVHIENFKSIDSIDLNCKRINIFIGPPGSGKSNILEAIGLISKYTLDKFPESIGVYDYNKLASMFYRNNIYKSLVIGINGEKLEVNYNGDETVSDLKSKIENKIKNNKLLSELYEKIKFYRFKIEKILFGNSILTPFLYPPYGENLIDIVKINKDILNEITNEFLDEYGLLVANVRGSRELFLVYKEDIKNLEKNLSIPFIPFYQISDGIIRYIFNLLAIETNRDSIILLEEPESNIFPSYIKNIAFKISRSNNQFFITTHNELLVETLLEEVNIDDISIFWVDFKEKTIVKEISGEKLKELVNESMLNNIFFAAEKI